VKLEYNIGVPAKKEEGSKQPDTPPFSSINGATLAHGTYRRHGPFHNLTAAPALQLKEVKKFQVQRFSKVHRVAFLARTIRASVCRVDMALALFRGDHADLSAGQT